MLVVEQTAIGKNGTVGAREDLLAAARSLQARGIRAFSPAQLIAEARSAGSIYPDTTLRTFIVGPMCLNSPDHHAVQYGDLERVARALYRLVSASDSTAAAPEVPPGPEALVDAAVQNVTLGDGEEWFWEGNVQSSVVRHLVEKGWSIRRVANTATSEHGVDVETDRLGERMIVEVKGYPGGTYLRGDRRGQPKNWHVGAQARTYFSNALLSGMLMRGDEQDARVVLAFPDVPTYRSLAQRVAVPLAHARIELWFVAQDGTVAEPVEDEERPRLT